MSSAIGTMPTQETHSDADRLDWLSDQKYMQWGIAHDSRTKRWVLEIRTGTLIQRANSLREAIDKAMDR
jgi:hypothetical protein